MGLRSWLARSAAERVHVLVVEVPGSFRLRVAVEREIAARGWVLAEAPADADLLVLCGAPGERLVGPVDEVYDAMPGPRARVVVPDPDGVVPSLDHGRDVLLDEGHQVADARDRAPAGEEMPGGTDHGDMDHGDMDHGDMEMAPSGIPLAGGAEDRDGLEMDVLHLPLGPVLTHWPAGLVLTCTLHGDVVGEASVEQVPGPPPTADHDRLAALEAAGRVDAVASVLALAGWPDGAAAARTARNACLDGAGDAERQLARLHRRTARARTLRWLLRGTGPVTEDVVARAGLPGTLAGDTYDRIGALLGEARQVLADDRVPRCDDRALRELLPDLATGLDLAAVRLLVAGLAPGLRSQPAEATHA